MDSKLLTTPNILTIFRLILVPVFLLVFLQLSTSYALAIFVMAGITDILDGYIARKNNLITNLGKVLDPLADKLMRLSAVIGFVIIDVLPLWVLIVVLLMDAFLVITSAFLYKKHYIVSSNKMGKFAGFFSMVALILCFFHNVVYPVHLIFVYVSLVLVLISSSLYVYRVLNDIKYKS